jgi:predicted short-subunit dehydrogenase-like oxidoreductase (DUF2520 family)
MIAKTKTAERRTTTKPSVAIVGAGSLGTFLAVALHDAGYTVTEIVVRNSPQSRRHARTVAAKVGARVCTADSAALEASLLWLCVPDREIRIAALVLAGRIAVLAAHQKQKYRVRTRIRFALHSSGALLSRELDPLREAGVAVASVHPLMTFVAEAHPSLTGVPFAMEGDTRAKRVARRIVRDLGGESFLLPAPRKAAYHAWATLTSPLLLAFLVTLEKAAHAAGLTREDARRKSLPIIRQTLENYSRLGPAKSFSGPLIRGDSETVAKHLSALKQHPRAREVYIALARAAVRGLPVKNRDGIERVLLA